MAKEFKEYDRIYREFANTILEKGIHSGDEEYIFQWRHAVHKHSPEDVELAVYGSATSSDWQKFRVSLKGQSTRMKLYRLNYRLMKMVLLEDTQEQSLERIRIDNYIGALRRGGQLNANMEIVR